MIVFIGDSVAVSLDPSGTAGVAVPVDGGTSVSGWIRRNGPRDGASGVTATGPDSGGIYTLSFSIPGTYAVGDFLEFWGSFVAGGITYQGKLSSARIAAKVATPIAANLTELNGLALPLDGSGRLEVNAVTGNAGVTVTPIQASVNNPRYATRDLAPMAQGSAPVDAWTITDGAGNPINLSDKLVRFVAVKSTLPAGDCNPFDATLAAQWKYETGGSGITITGAANNIVSVQHSATNTALVAQLSYWLLNVTDLLPLASGKLCIRPALWNYP